MKVSIKSLYPALLALAVVGGVSTEKAAGANVKFIGAGSSAMFQQFAIAAVNDPTIAGAGSHHYTIKGKCTGGVNCAQAFDNRTGPGGTVQDHQGGNMWVVWDSTQTNIWVYLSVDSTVGNRLFFAVPRATLQVSTDTAIAGKEQNLISPLLFKYGVHTSDPGCPASGPGSTTCDDPTIPAGVYNAINNAKLTAAMTDIRPEDALFASNRTLCTPNNGTTCLGYGPGPVGTPIKGSVPNSAAVATPVVFAISGTDPVSGQNIPASSTFPVGAQPIVLIVNKLSGGYTTPGNATHQQLQSLFSGIQCNILGHTTTAELREPLSGTMNTFEFTNMTNPSFSAGHSQETGVTTNPLNQSCPGGARLRGIGTGEIVSGLVGLTTQSVNAIGYVFFSYGNVSKITNGSLYGYLNLDSVDPLVGNPGYVAGQLPTCALPCAVAPNTTFKNLRNGMYRSWSMLRAVTDASGNNFANTKALVTAAQNAINSYVPDFVPYVPANGDSGMQYYRSHFGSGANNGLPFAEPSTEKGGDVGGCIEPKTVNVLNAHENVPNGCAK